MSSQWLLHGLEVTRTDANTLETKEHREWTDIVEMILPRQTVARRVAVGGETGPLSYGDEYILKYE